MEVEFPALGLIWADSFCGEFRMLLLADRASDFGAGFFTAFAIAGLSVGDDLGMAWAKSAARRARCNPTTRRSVDDKEKPAGFLLRRASKYSFSSIHSWWRVEMEFFVFIAACMSWLWI